MLDCSDISDVKESKTSSEKAVEEAGEVSLLQGLLFHQACSQKNDMITSNMKVLENDDVLISSI